MDAINGTSALKRDNQRFTLEEWRSWPEGERWELIDGIAYAMSPAPRVPHQKSVGNLFSKLDRFLEGQPCQALIAPLDVFLSDETGDDTVVEPDVLVVCDQSKVQDDGIHGAPDFVAEILSDSTAFKDLGVKKQLYERGGVREYWIIHPLTKAVTVFLLSDGRFLPGREYPSGQDVPCAVLPGFVWRCL
jgi:Uma2 family endonuclease